MITIKIDCIKHWYILVWPSQGANHIYENEKSTSNQGKNSTDKAMYTIQKIL